MEAMGSEQGSCSEFLANVQAPHASHRHLIATARVLGPNFTSSVLFNAFRLTVDGSRPHGVHYHPMPHCI